MRIADVLNGKGAQVTTVTPHAAVSEVLRLIAEQNLGALPVVDVDRLVGIVSERDVVRRLHDRGVDLLTVTVPEIMTSDVVTCDLNDEVGELAKIWSS